MYAIRSYYERAGDRDALLLPTGNARGRDAGEVGEAQLLQQDLAAAAREIESPALRGGLPNLRTTLV